METPPENRKIEIGHVALKNLNTTRKWAMFIAILGFIILGLIIILGVIAGTFLSAFTTVESGPGIPESLMLVILLVLAVLYFFPLLFLFRFSKHTARAVKTLDYQDLNKALKNLKYYFVYLGVLIIVVLSLYFVAIIIAGTSMASLWELG